MNGPVVFWDLSCVPKDYREGEREDIFCFWKWERKQELVSVKTRYP
ncbi:unnamed protein product, partial [Staurois parvus]